MVFIRTIFGALIGAIIALTIFYVIPFTPDLSDWGGRAFPRSYITPLIIVTITGYISAWIGAKFSPDTGRLSGMFAAIVTGIVIIAFSYNPDLLSPLFHHPAYPVFSDHTLLALALLLVAGHLGGLRVEKSHSASSSSEPQATSI